MSFDKGLLILYVLMPFVAALLPWRRVVARGMISPGSVASLVRIALLVMLSGTVVSAGGSVTVSGTLVSGYPLDFVLLLDSYRFGFLLIAEFCFLLAHWMISLRAPHERLIRVLICLAQGFCSLLVASENAVTTGGLQILAGAVFFYLVRFSIVGGPEGLGASISRKMYLLYFMLGLLMIGWGIVEFGDRNLLFAKGSGSPGGLVIWMLLLVLTVPLPPWSKWFNESVEHLPEGVTLTLVTFFSGVALKLAALFTVVYPDLSAREKMVLYILGIVGCSFSINGLFASESRRRMLGSLPSFFFSLLLIAVGVSSRSLVLSAYYICLFLPVFTGLVLYASGMKLGSPMQKTFIGLMFALVLGLPGTPVFMILSGIGARSLDMGVGFTLVFGLIWFFYFSANVHICRRIFMDQERVASDPEARLDESPMIFAGYGIFLMVLITLVTQVAGRIL